MRQRVVVLGLDGVPCTLLERFAREGVMPNTARLLERGTLCSMTATIPEVSSTSWSSFMTGVNPGKHGIYGFTDLRPGSYAVTFPNSADLRRKTIWEIAGEAGRRCIVINVPSTYPARPLHGMTVAGFVALDLKKAAYPERMYEYLHGIGYRLDVDTVRAARSLPVLSDDIRATFAKRIEAINHLFTTEASDLFLAVITETDRLHHFLWEALEEVSHPQHGFFVDFYRELDRFIGEFAGRLEDGAPFIMLSDHGFGRVRSEVNLNVFLRQQGYLSFSKERPETFEEMDATSRAFVLDPARVYLHMEGRYPRGCVRASEYEGLRAALKEEFLALKVDGRPVVRDVRFREEIYHGECLGSAPDMVLLPHEGFDLKGTIRQQELCGRGTLTGGHTRENALFFINRSVSCRDVNIVDVGATLAELLQVPTEGMDGRVLV